MKFVTVDFETANPSRDSICSIGLAKFENGELIDTMETLINPEDYFDSYISKIHGITPELVENAPTFKEFYHKFVSFIEGYTLVAHNTSFDMSVIRHTCDKYNLNYPTLSYICTYRIARVVLPNENKYKLNILSEKYGITLNHHNALDDAIACGKILSIFIHDSGHTSLDSFLSSINANKGSMFPTSYESDSIRRTTKRKEYSKITTNNTEFDTNHPFYNKKVTFTGALKSFTRSEAIQMLVDVGGQYRKNVSTLVNYVVIGHYDNVNLTKENKMSSKVSKLYSLQDKGHDIIALTEEDFLKMIK